MNNLDELLSLSDMEATQKLVSEGFTVKDIYKIGRMVGRMQMLLSFNEINNDDDRINGDETNTETDEHRGSDEQTEEVNTQE